MEPNFLQEFRNLKCPKEKQCNQKRTVILSQLRQVLVHIEANFPANIYLFKVNNRNTRKMCELCSKLIIKTTKRRDVILVFYL